jgi:hypothetical protein
MGTPTSFSSPADLVRVIFELASLFLCALGCVVVGRVASSWVFGSLIADLTWVVFGAFASQHLSHYLSACAAVRSLGQRYPVAEDSDYNELADEQDDDENNDGDGDGDGDSDGDRDSDGTSGGAQTVLAESLNHTPTPGATQFTPVMYELDHPFESAVSVWWGLTTPGTFADYLEGKLKRVEVVRSDAATSHSMGRSSMESKHGDATSAHNCVRRRVLYFEGNPPWWVKRLMSSAGIEIVEESIRDAEGKVRRRREE